MESIEETERLLSTYYQAIEVENTGLLYRHRKLVLFVLVLVALAIIVITSILVISFVVIPTSNPAPAQGQVTSLKILSLSVWGSPESFGTRDKTERIEAIAEYIENHTEIDMFLL